MSSHGLLEMTEKNMEKWYRVIGAIFFSPFPLTRTTFLANQLLWKRKEITSGISRLSSAIRISRKQHVVGKKGGNKQVGLGQRMIPDCSRFLIMGYYTLLQTLCPSFQAADIFLKRCIK